MYILLVCRVRRVVNKLYSEQGFCAKIMKKGKTVKMLVIAMKFQFGFRFKGSLSIANEMCRIFAEVGHLFSKYLLVRKILST